jgi:imidazolonepropionase-like amidohydrolase
MIGKFFLLAGVLVLAPLPAALADQAPALRIVQAGQLLDRPGQPPRGAATLLIEGERIAELRDGHHGPAAFQLVDVEVIDLREYFVLPGLIDTHVHLSSDLGGIARMFAGVSQSQADVAYEAARNARKTLHAGFTTVRNLGDRDGIIRALRDAIDAGKVEGPRIQTANTGISATTGHSDPTLALRPELHAAVDRGENLCDGVESCRRAVRHQIAQGADLIKMSITGGVNSPIGLGLDAQMFKDEARAVIETAKLYDKKVAVHAHGANGIRLALRLGADSIEHGTLLDAEGLRLFRESGAYYVPTLSVVNGYIERLAANPEAYTGEVLAKIRWRIEITGRSLERAVPAGVKIAFGTDAGVSLHGRNADEFELMVQHGMTPEQAIVAATVNAADLMGMSTEIGTLEPGKYADLVAVRSNPLEDVTVLKEVGRVMKGGVLVH